MTRSKWRVAFSVVRVTFESREGHSGVVMEVMGVLRRTQPASMAGLESVSMVEL